MEGFCQIYRVEDWEFQNKTCIHCGQGQNVHSMPNNAGVLAVLLKERKRSSKKKRKAERELEELAVAKRRASRFEALADSLLEDIKHQNGDLKLVECFSLTEETADFRPPPGEDQEYQPCDNCEDRLCILAELGPKEDQEQEVEAQYIPYKELVKQHNEMVKQHQQ